VEIKPEAEEFLAAPGKLLRNAGSYGRKKVSAYFFQP
jgi:hypothetical protein